MSGMGYALLVLAALPRPSQAVDVFGGINNVVQGVKSVFGGGRGGDQSATQAAGGAQAYGEEPSLQQSSEAALDGALRPNCVVIAGPIVTKTVAAMLANVLPAEQGNSSTSVSLPCGPSCWYVTVQHSQPNQILLLFQVGWRKRHRHW